MKKTIAVDFDEVLVSLFPEIIRFWNEREGTRIAVEQIHSHDLSKVWKCTHEETRQKMETCIHEGVLRSLSPIEGAVEATKYIARHHSITIVTARPDVVEQDTRHVLEQYFPHLSDCEIIFCNIYHDPNRARAKHEVCNEIGADWIIDDNPQHVFGCAKIGIPGIIFGNYPWNRVSRISENVKQIEHWKSIPDVI